jgi:short subunit dehydrogenase-like uncharacterized protein
MCLYDLEVGNRDTSTEKLDSLITTNSQSENILLNENIKQEVNTNTIQRVNEVQFSIPPVVNSVPFGSVSSSPTLASPRRARGRPRKYPDKFAAAQARKEREAQKRLQMCSEPQLSSNGSNNTFFDHLLNFTFVSYFTQSVLSYGTP